MGTSHRHTPGIAGEPNWGKASSAITNVAKAEDKSEQLTNNPPANVSQKQIAKRQASYSKSITRGYHHAVRNLIRAAGGRTKVSSGTSRALGRAGVYVAGALASTIADIAQKGLHNWLFENGFGDRTEKTCIEILHFLRKYLSCDVVGMDETAANEALGYILDKFEDKIDEDASNFDEVMKTTMSTSAINEVVDEYMGMYVYSHLSQNFKEKLEHERGTTITTATLEEIKDLIMDDVRRGYNGHTASTIDWTGEEGKTFIQHEFNRIIYIISGNED